MVTAMGGNPASPRLRSIYIAAVSAITMLPDVIQFMITVRN
jgi:hypothetical protein